MAARQPCEAAPLVPPHASVELDSTSPGARPPAGRWATAVAFSLMCFVTAGDFVLAFQLDTVASRLGIARTDAPQMAKLAAAASLVYFSRLAGRLLHGVVFGWMHPRHRVVLGAVGCIVGNATLLVAYFATQEPLTTSITWFAVSSLVTGFSAGTLVANGLSVLGTLDPSIKGAAAAGFNTGWNVCGALVFGVQASSSQPTQQYGLVAGLLVAVMIGFVFTIVAHFIAVRSVPDDNVQYSVSKTFADLSHIRRWLPPIALTTGATCLAGAISSMTPVVAQVYYSSVPRTEILPGIYGAPQWGLCVGCATVALVGGAVGRQSPSVANHVRIALGMCFVSLAMSLSTYPPLGLLIAPALAYVPATLEVGAGSADVDRKVAREDHLIVTSFWIMAFDVGVGSGTALGGLVAWSLRGVRAPPGAA